MTLTDEWLAHQRAIVLRLPRWLVGSALIASLALGIEWALTTSGPAPVLVHFIGGSARGDAVAALGTATAPVVCMIALYVSPVWFGRKPRVTCPPLGWSRLIRP